MINNKKLISDVLDAIKPSRMDIRMPDCFIQYLNMLSKKTGKSKTELLYECLSSIYPNSLEELIGEKTFEAIEELIITNVLNRYNEDTKKDFGLYIAINFINADDESLAINVFDLISDDANSTIGVRNSFVKLITFKQEYINQIRKIFMNSDEIKQKYLESMHMIMGGR